MAKIINRAKVKMGHIIKVWNTERPKFSNANTTYHVIHCQQGDREFPIMLTEKELERAAYRATQNPEDVPKKGFLTNIFD
jgi:hypothetical protein